MSRSRTIKHFLKRGALLAAANWQVVIIQFVADAFFKTLLLVPVVGGVALVVLLIGGDPAELMDLDARRVLPTLAGVLVAQPVALAAFLIAVGVVIGGGSVLMFFIKGGTVTVLLDADRVAGPIEQPPLRVTALRRASRFSLERFTQGARDLFRRYLRLGLALGVVYGLSIVAYFVFVFGSPNEPDSRWTTIAAVASTGVVLWFTVVNFVYLLFQIVMAADGCGLRAALPRVVMLLARETAVMGSIFVAILALVLLTTAASILAAAALGLIAFVPFIGLAALPLQLLAWLLRGVVFQFIGLAALVAYLHTYRQHRGFVDAPALEESLHSIGRTA